MRLKKLLGNSLLTLCSIVVVWLALELFLFDFLLPHLPKGAYHHMVREFRVMGQSSFPARLPREGYVAMVGDSNAQGKGDWFINQGYDRNAQYHSAHVLQEILDKDVLTFGRSGAGSLEGFALEPVQIIARLKRHGIEFPGPPSMVLACFYEGNDIENNLDFLENRVPLGEREKVLKWASRAADSPKARQSLTLELRAIQAEEADGSARKLDEIPIVANFLLRMVRNTIRNTFTRKYIDVEPIVPPGEVNKAVVAGDAVPLPDRLQSPPMNLAADDVDQGVAVMQASLALLAERFPRVVLVYVPSPLACYRLDSAEVSTYYGGDTLYPARQVSKASDELYAKVAQAARDLDIECVDTRPKLRKAASMVLIHGPRDWDHFNKAGYHALAEAMAMGLDTPR